MIKLTELTKNFNNLRAIDKISFHIEEGEIFGLLGPNGAGKTTTVRILTTLTRAASGEAKIKGLDVVKEADRVKRIIGLCPQEINLDRELTGEENLYIHGLLYEMKEMPQKIKELLDWAGLAERAKDLVRTYSGGMQRRLLISRAIMHRPQVLFLDEPTVGLDPRIRREIWDLIRDLNVQGTTILLTTHYIEEAEMLCHRVGILSHGELVALDTPAALKAEVGKWAVELLNETKVRYELFNSKEDAYRFAEPFKGKALIRESNLEDVFIRLTGERITNGKS